MTRYFMNLHECGHVLPDDEGFDAPDLEAIHEHAVQAARDVMSHEVAEGRLCLSCHIEVLDEAGRTVLIVRFRDAVSVTGIDRNLPPAP